MTENTPEVPRSPVTIRSIDAIITRDLTPHRIVLLQNISLSLPIKKFPTFYGTYRFITVCRSSRPPLSLNQMNPVYKVPSYFFKSYFKLFSPVFQ
jgi:hypothetical protein